MPHAGSRPACEAALKQIDATLSAEPQAAATSRPTFHNDMKFAATLIAGAVRKGSWKRNASWVRKYQAYARDNHTAAGYEKSMTAALLSDKMALGFLVSVQREQPRAKT